MGPVGPEVEPIEPDAFVANGVPIELLRHGCLGAIELAVMDGDVSGCRLVEPVLTWMSS